jgi:CheY-like chemotaxis protein
MKRLRDFKAYILGEKRHSFAGSYPAVADSLRSILGIKVWEGIKRRTPDRRQIMGEAATVKGVSEEDLIKLVAESLDMPVFFRPKPTDVDFLPDGIILPDLRRAGILPIIAQGIVTGVVCVDPAELNLMPQLYAGSNIYLSSWQAILASLDESEQLYREKKSQEALEKRAQEVLIYRKVIGRLAEQARELHSQQISLTSDVETLAYSFRDETGGTWSGNIDVKVAGQLACYLEESIAEGRTTIEAVDFNGQSLALDLGVEHGRILLSFPPNLSEEFSITQEKTKVMQFPRLVKHEEIELMTIFSNGEEADVLLVEDNPTFALVLKKFLAKQGMQIEICHSIDAAISSLKERKSKLPDLILSDLHMPGINGLEFIRRLKQDQIFKQIPIVALTSDESPETELSLLGVGADAFVTKNPRILCLHAKRLIELRRAA